MGETCRDILAELEPFLDGELAKRKRRKVSQHLTVCPDCAGELELLKLQGDALRGMVAAAAEKADFARMRNEVLARLQIAKPLPWGERLELWLGETLFHYRVVWLSSLATALLLVTAALLWLQPLKNVDNEVIIDSMEYLGQSSSVFMVSKNNTTVIWVYDFDRADPKTNEGDDL